MTDHTLPQTTQGALEWVWPDIGNPMVSGWTDAQKLVAQQLAGAARLYAAFGEVYEQVAVGALTQDEALTRLAIAAWGHR